MNADDLPTLRDELQAHGLWANKGLGQHFLLDLNITRRIAKTAGDIAGKPVIEIGPGPGGLTRALLEAGADPLIVIEKDPRFVPLLEPLIEWSEGKLQIVQGDALNVDESKLAAHASVVSNLPYNVGTPLLVKWLKAGAWRGDMTLMFQKEVAHCRLEFTVPARAFTPPPKIASAIVRLTALTDPYPHLDALERVTGAAFGQRRKMLRAALRSLTPDAEDLLRAADITPTARAEEVDQAGFRRLADAWRLSATA